MPDPLSHRLAQLVGPDQLLEDHDRVARYVRDWTGRWQGDCRCVVRPASADQVAAVVTACGRAAVPVVVQGGNTGLVGGAVPTEGAVLLSTERLDEVGDVDATAGRVLVGAGATLASVQTAADAAGWAVGVDLASRDSATIGGMVATDAGGSRVVAHGPMRDQVLGLEVVLADGTVARPWMEGLDKDTAGYDLRQLLVGSEGTLGIITRVLLRLVRPTPTAATLLLGATTTGLGELVAAVRARVAESPARMTACEFMTDDGVALVADTLGTPSPVDSAVTLLVDLAGDVPDDLLADLDDLSTTPSAAGLDERGRDRLWRLRERHTEAISTRGVPLKMDVGVPPNRLAWFLDAVREAVAAAATPTATCILFGHAAEGNVHVNVTGADGHETAVEAAVYRLVAEAGGTVSAEHGIGRAKVDHLALTRDHGTIAAMRRLKDALDPGGLLNPGVALPPETH